LKTLVLSGTFLAMGIVWIELVSGAVLVALGLKIAVEDA